LRNAECGMGNAEWDAPREWDRACGMRNGGPTIDDGPWTMDHGPVTSDYGLRAVESEGELRNAECGMRDGTNAGRAGMRIAECGARGAEAYRDYVASFTITV
jgi:hypothetical protein